MTKQRTDEHAGSQREKDHAEMLEAALARPGIREVMKVYGNWQDKDKALDAHRSATKQAERIVTTNSSSAS
ncbi:MAG: hypothetical protein OXH52_10360 [Gammaproteobacteria bacterium]|nr:hypothetical protein [Gammaproteobacteria bacterium]